ncbi:MAG TPA: 50S ribosomal protein L11 methyltransferase [Solirubrobacteraceae bacterium]
MREVVLRVPKLAVEDILDRLLPIVPGGVREVPAGLHIDLLMRGPEVPSRDEIEPLCGRWPHVLSEREIPDDWRARRLADYRPDPIAGRLVVRPEWAPVTRDMIDIVLGESAAFGAGTHPTTRTCLEQLLELEPAQRFADLGCGTGVLAILAAKLGWASVMAVDVEPGSVAAAVANAALNGVALEGAVVDLMSQAPPPASAFAANVPPAVHVAVAERLADPVPTSGLLSGFATSQADDVIRAYAARGLRERRQIETQGWAVVVIGRR